MASAPAHSSQVVVCEGWLTKLGANVKNWKKRYVILSKNGRFRYFKKQVPVNTDVEAQGDFNIQNDCIELYRWADVNASGLVKWPKEAVSASGFGFKMRNGRTYFMYATSLFEGEMWLDGMLAVGANIQFRDVPSSSMSVRRTQTLEEKAAAEKKAAADAVALVAETAAVSVEEKNTSSGMKPIATPQTEQASKGFIHQVVGGVVVRTETIMNPVKGDSVPERA